MKRTLAVQTSKCPPPQPSQPRKIRRRELVDEKEIKINQELGLLIPLMKGELYLYRCMPLYSFILLADESFVKTYELSPFYDRQCQADTWIRKGSSLTDQKCLFMSTAIHCEELSDKIFCSGTNQMFRFRLDAHTSRLILYDHGRGVKGRRDSQQKLLTSLGRAGVPVRYEDAKDPSYTQEIVLESPPPVPLKNTLYLNPDQPETYVIPAFDTELLYDIHYAFDKSGTGLTSHRNSETIGEVLLLSSGIPLVNFEMWIEGEGWVVMDREKLHQLCRQMIEETTSPRPFPRPSTPISTVELKPKSELSILQQNIHTYHDLSESPLNLLLPFDLICLQEDTDQYHQEYQKHYLIFKCPTGETVEKSKRMYNTILIKREIVHHSERLSSACLSSKSPIYAPRVFNVVRVWIQNEDLDLPVPVLLVNLHLTGGRYDDKVYKGLQKRTQPWMCAKKEEMWDLIQQVTHHRDQQLHQLMEWISPQLLPHEKVLLIGDTNIPFEKYPDVETPYYQKEYQSYYQSGLDFLKSAGFQEIPHPVDLNSSMIRIDGVFPDRGFLLDLEGQLKVNSSKFKPIISDHYGIVNQIRC